MPNAYLISSEYRGGPSPGKDPSLSINEHHLGPGSVETLFIVGDNKKGHINLGNGLTVSNVKTLAPIAPYLKPGRDRVGVELSGFKISSEVGNRDLAQAIAVTMQVSVSADGETFHPRKT